MVEEQSGLNEEIYLDENERNEVYFKESLIEKIAARRKIIVIGLSITLALTVGTVMYTSAQEPKSSQYGNGDSFNYGYQYAGQYSGQNSQYDAQYAVQNNGGGNGTAVVGGGCGGGAGSGGGGCCGGGGVAASSATATASPAELEKQALEQYKAETGKTDVTVKVENRGCHTQIDIYDKAGNIVRSYGYQGGPLYVI